MGAAVAASEDFASVKAGYVAASQDARGVRLTCYVEYPGSYSEAEVLTMVEDNVLPNLPSHFSAKFNRKYALVVPDQEIRPQMLAVHVGADNVALEQELPITADPVEVKSSR